MTLMDKIVKILDEAYNSAHKDYCNALKGSREQDINLSLMYLFKHLKAGVKVVQEEN